MPVALVRLLVPLHLLFVLLGGCVVCCEQPRLRSRYRALLLLLLLLVVVVVVVHRGVVCMAYINCPHARGWVRRVCHWRKVKLDVGIHASHKGIVRIVFKGDQWEGRIHIAPLPHQLHQHHTYGLRQWPATPAAQKKSPRERENVCVCE